MGRNNGAEGREGELRSFGGGAERTGKERGVSKNIIHQLNLNYVIVSPSIPFLQYVHF